MASDILNRLRGGKTDGSNHRWTVTPIHLEAADEIELLRIALLSQETEALGYLRAVGTLQRRVEELEAALKPFATDADIYDGQDISDGEKSFNDNVTVGDLRRARALIKEQKKDG